MKASISYLEELLHSLRGATKPVIESDNTIDATWEQVFEVTASLQKAKDAETIQDGNVEAIIGKLREFLTEKYPDATLVEDAIVGEIGVSFSTGEGKEKKYIAVY